MFYFTLLTGFSERTVVANVQMDKRPRYYVHAINLSRVVLGSGMVSFNINVRLGPIYVGSGEGGPWGHTKMAMYCMSNGYFTPC